MARRSLLPTSELVWMQSPMRKCADKTKDFYLAGSSDVARAKAVCNGMDGRIELQEDGTYVQVGGYTCPFRDTCLRHALDHKEIYGVWGGTSERDRRKILRARKRLRTAVIYSMEDVRFSGAINVARQPVVVVRRRAAVG